MVSRCRSALQSIGRTCPLSSSRVMVTFRRRCSSNAVTLRSVTASGRSWHWCVTVSVRVSHAVSQPPVAIRSAFFLTYCRQTTHQTISKHVGIARVGVALPRLLHLKGQALHPAPHGLYARPRSIPEPRSASSCHQRFRELPV